MTNRKPVTKLTLVSAVVALMLCFAMLLGTTYAWFTDSVTSAGNIIKTGELNIDLLIKADDDTEYVSVKANPGKKAFYYDKWEPGYTAWVNAKVKTTGNLALKYTMTITPDGDPGDLANVIDVYYKAEEVAKPTNGRDLSGLTRLGTLADVLNGTITINDTLIPGTGSDANTEDFATLALHMQETAGNEYQNLTVGTTGFSLTILATQLNYESDSFGNDYDAYALYPDATYVASAAELITALGNAEDGDVIGLTGNIVLEAPLTITDDVKIVGAGGVVISNSPITTQGNVEFEHVAFAKPTNAASNASMIYVNGDAESLVLDGCTFANPQWEVVQFTSSSMKSLVVTNCTFIANDVEGSAASGYAGNGEHDCLRYIHVQPNINDNVTGVEIVITGNTFKNIDHVTDSICGIYYVEGNITIGNNTFEDWAENDLNEGKAAKLSVHWPENETLKAVALWEQTTNTTYTIAGN